MSDVNVQLVREFFELNGFRVMTYWQHDTVRPRAPDHGLQLFVENGAPVGPRPSEFVLQVGDVAGVTHALVEVRAWHADRFYASVIQSNPVLFEVASEESLARARDALGSPDLCTILVVSELPMSGEARRRAVALLEDGGISHIIEFPTVLHEILSKISAGVSYAPSHTLQTLRLLKRYGFVRRQQLEFKFPTEPPVPPVGPPVDTADAPEAVDEEELF